jgi:L,D-transpeptidase ErfK/SrfK
MLMAASALTSAADLRPAVTGACFTHTVSRGETLRSIASRYGVDPATILIDTTLPPNATLNAGMALRIDNRHLIPARTDSRAIVINVPQRLLFATDGGATRAMPIAVGRPDWRTAIGEFTVIDRRVDPTWHVPPSILVEARRAGKTQAATVPPGPHNPLGKYWLGLSLTGIGVHGTNAPTSIYQALTHGCIRMNADDIAWLFERTAIGDVGEIVYEPILLASVNGDVLLESHRDIYARIPDANRLLRELAANAGLSELIDWPRAEAVLAAQAGIVRSIAK